ncbi:TetR/AcrR family transcriptional regulator [Actinocorallia longicatena]|uniref:TetR/AcrR family transcriptional regulator n=1 Tax=Actinocorallia longicatena TaxID=111803 RepID=A0ABP6QES6_9ACTN
MNAVKPRREIYAETTRRALLETGRLYFLERGYAAVSAEELVRAAGLTRGALYHHFDGKQGLFEAVFEEVQNEGLHRVGRAMAALPGSPEGQVVAGMEAYLDVCAEPAYREIVLLQGPVALGRERWLELHHTMRGVLLHGVTTLIDGGHLREQPAETAAAALYGALTELSLTITEAPDPATARAGATAVLRGFLASLA